MQTLDGVVAIPGLDRSNAVIAAESDADRFVMALLRACADAILIGAGTLRSSPAGTWRPDRAYPPAADALAALRRSRGAPELPLVAVLTGGASLDATHPLLERGVTVLTTERAAAGLRARVPAASEVVAVHGGDTVDLAAALALLRDRGHELILSEAGPTVLGGLLAGDLVDELFLTVSPLVAGRAGAPRLALVEGVELLPDVRVEASLRSLRRDGDHLLVRYALARAA